jgi:hypothetical protein
MGTQFQDGQKPKNKITISKGGAAEHIIGPDGKTDRSFAQPNPTLPPREITPKAHASAQDEVEALTQNSTRGRAYTPKAAKVDEDEDVVPASE